MKYVCSLLAGLLAALLLTGCAQRDVPTATSAHALIQDLQYGEFKQDLLSSLPWDSGRCEITSGYTMAETDIGYYLVNDQYLWYADKSDLNNWVPVCRKPECTHKRGTNCSANIQSDSIVRKGDRLYYLQSTRHNDLYPDIAVGVVLASMALDGTDQRLEYVLEEAISTQEGGSQSLLTPDYWLCQTQYIDSRGNQVTRVFRIANNEKTEYPTGHNTANANTEFAWMQDVLKVYGEPYFFCVPMGSGNNLISGDVFLIRGDELVRQDISLILKDQEYTGMYLWENTLRLFRRNKGYYDRNLSTGQETKLESHCIKNSNSFLVLPNCIIETTLHSSTIPFRKDNLQHKMALFDGQKWRSVELPKNLKKTPSSGYVDIISVTSDSIILCYRDSAAFSADMELYCVRLDARQLTVQYIATIENPPLK